MKTAAVAAALVIAGCGGNSDDDTSGPSAGAPAPGGGLSIQEAIESELDGPLMVRGFYVEAQAEPRLCSALLESYPPQCGEPSLRLDGEVELHGPTEANGVTWTDQEMSVLGDVRDGSLAVSETRR